MEKKNCENITWVKTCNKNIFKQLEWKSDILDKSEKRVLQRSFI